ncbi:MAG: patatin-like phospholipase family protein [Hyphomicrobiaceae bacterium]
MFDTTDYIDRDWHLDTRAGEGKRILCLDGGGVRGLIALGILKRIEETLAPRYPGKPEDFRLCYYFDLISGTSTGAIAAAALALGMSVDEVREHYTVMCPNIFSKQPDTSFKGRWLPEGTLKPVFDQAAIEAALRSIAGERELQSPDIATGLMVCTKRLDTGSPWVLTNSPNAPYWEKGRNKSYKLWRVLRASAAAPLFFEPFEFEIAPPDGIYDGEVGVFVDGAVAGLNNPSLQTFLTATLKPYGLGWPCGADNLFMVSIGTGTWRQRVDRHKFMTLDNWHKARTAILGMIPDASRQAIVTLQAMSNPRKPWHIDSEIFDLDGHLCRDEEMLSFQRYDAVLEEEQLRRIFPEAKIDLDQLRDLGNADPQTLRRLYAIGHAVGNVSRPGRDGIEAADFPAIFDPPGFVSDASFPK